MTETDPTQAEMAVPPQTETVVSANRPTESSRRRFDWEAVAVLLFLAILAVAAYFRFTGLDWDRAYHLHPDERFLTDVANLLQPVESPLDYLRTSESTLNPYNVGKGLYVYGNFPMTVTRYAAEWIQGACTAFSLDCAYAYNTYNGVHVVGRFLSGLIDLVGIAFLFLLGRRLYGWKVGVLAALLQALAVMPIQQSHFFTMDNWAAGLTVVTLYTAVRAAGFGDEEKEENGRFPYHWYLLFGLSVGLTVASRINVAPLAAIIGLAGLIWLARRYPALRLWLRPGDWSETQRVAVQRVALGGLLAALATLITFRLAQPYAFVDAELARQTAVEQTGTSPGPIAAALRTLVGLNPQWLGNMEEIQRLQSPEASFPPAVQWTDRAPLLFPLTNMILYGMGITAALAAWLGFFWAAWRIATSRPDWARHLIPVVWSGGYFLFMGARWVKSVRYFLPIYPTLFLLGGWALWFIWRRASQAERRPKLKQMGAAALIALVIAPSFLWANSFLDIYRAPVTRVQASHWIYQNVPSGATLLYSADGAEKELQLPLKSFDFYSDGPPLTLPVTLPEEGTITAVRFNYLQDGDGDDAAVSDVEQLEVRLDAPEATAGPVIVDLDLDERRRAVTVELPETAVPADTTITLSASVPRGGGPIKATTSVIANEHWDDLLPISLEGYNAYGAYYTEVNGGQRPVTHPAGEEKREQMIDWIEQADYIMLSSQRALWSLPRIPLTYPLMLTYYDALFNEEMGFELVAQFHAQHQFGPLYVSDTGGALSWGEPPQIGWPPPPEWAAEEAFSVYDHPPVWIFRKTDAYSRQQVVDLLNEVDLAQAVTMNPLEATQAPDGLMLSEAEWEWQQAGGTFRQIFAVDGILNQNPALAAAVWWLATVILGWPAFPLAFVILRGLPDRGYALARVLALLLISYFGWFLASYNLLPNTRLTLLLGVFLLGLAGLLLYVRRRRAIAAFVGDNLRYIAAVEGLGLLLFLFMIGIRLGNPDVWDVIWGGEKPMDLSYFTAVLKSTTFPPYDPWFAGGYINYYYYGFVFVGALTKLLGIIPALAYNLILPMLFSFTGVGVFSIAYNLVEMRDRGREKGERRRKKGEGSHRHSSNLNLKATVAGLIAMTLALLLGNLAEVGVLINAWRQTGNAMLEENIPLIGGLMRVLDGGVKMLGGQATPGYASDWFWNASRAIAAPEGQVQPITEFPFFTFLYGDLHAHMIALPLTVLALGWAVALALQTARPKTTRPETTRLETALQWLVGGVAIGVLRATNTWDWPTYLVIGGLAVVYYVWRRNGRFSLPALLQSLLLVGLLAALSTLTVWPFIDHYGAAYTSVSLWPGAYTSVADYLTVYGLFLFFVVTHLAREFRAWTRTWTPAGLRELEPASGLLIAMPVGYLALLLFLLIQGYWIAPIVLTLIVIAGLLGLRPGLPPARRVILILIASALGLTLAVEIVVLDGDIGRMNTVFKFYMQVWILLSVVGGVTAVWAWPAIQRRAPTFRRAWVGVLILLVAAAALYPLLATPAKWRTRMNPDAPHTLNGMAFMQHTDYRDTNNSTIPLKYDYEAIQWIYRNVNGSPVMVEGHSHNNGGFSPYRTVTNRIAMYTGLPAVVGWDWHQRQQRATVPGFLVSNRINQVNAFYNTSDINQALDFLEQYDAAYIYVGQLEQTYYRPEGLQKFEQMAAAGYLEEVYRNDGTTIYRVIN